MEENRAPADAPEQQRDFFDLPRQRRRELIRQYHGTLARIGRRVRVTRAYVSEIALRPGLHRGERAQRVHAAIEAEFRMLRQRRDR